MNRVLLGYLWRSQRTKLLIVCVAMAAWNVFLPVIYQSFGVQMKGLVDSGIIPKQLTNFGVLDHLPVDRLPMLWLNGMLLWGGFATIGLAASVSFDRLTPALGVTVAIVIVMYFLDILGSLWPDAKGLQPYSLFHYLAS